jgi:hypothetical protein
VAGALRPIVILMLFASVLFVVAGILDGAYPGGSAWFTATSADFAALSYFFALINTVVAGLVAKGSERSLVLRIALAAFFVAERPVSAFLFGVKPIESIFTHLLTAAVELVILLSALRVWRLGRSFEPKDVDILFALEGSPPATGSGERQARPKTAALPARPAWVIAISAVLLALVLVGSAMYAGFVPGGAAQVIAADGSGWLLYLFAAVLLGVAARATRGETIALRALLAVALILFVERAFTPFFIREQDPVLLALHGIASLGSLAVAIAAADAIRGDEASALRTFEAA